MSDTKTNKTVGIDGLIEFGEYLTTLEQAPYRHYMFEMPDSAGRLKECSLDDTLASFRDFCAGKIDTFRVCIIYTDYQQGTLGSCDRTFTRRKP